MGTLISSLSIDVFLFLFLFLPFFFENSIERGTRNFPRFWFDLDDLYWGNRGSVNRLPDQLVPVVFLPLRPTKWQCELQQFFFILKGVKGRIDTRTQKNFVSVLQMSHPLKGAVFLYGQHCITVGMVIQISKIEIVVYYQCCILIGWAASGLYLTAH